MYLLFVVIDNQFMYIPSSFINGVNEWPRLSPPALLMSIPVVFLIFDWILCEKGRGGGRFQIRGIDMLIPQRERVERMYVLYTPFRFKVGSLGKSPCRRKKKGGGGG